MHLSDIMLQCSCGMVLSIRRTYFCRLCLAYRCLVCAEKDILSISCDNCFSLVQSNVSHLNKGKCLTCYTCPHCFNHLSLRMKKKLANDSTYYQRFSPEISYYLTCYFCSWSTHDVRIPDQKRISSFRSVTNDNRILKLIDFYRAICWNQTESHYSNFCAGSSLRSKYTVSETVAKLRSCTINMLAKNLPVNIPSLEPSLAEESNDVLPNEVFHSTVDQSEVSTIHQRLADPVRQPVTVMDFEPIRRQLVVKNLLRCQQCSHNLKLPSDESAIGFKVNQNCHYYVPTLRILKFDPLRYDSISELMMEVTNCFSYNIAVSFSQNLESPRSVLKTSLIRNVDIITLPKIPVLLPPKLKTSPISEGVQLRFLIHPNILACIGDDAIFTFVMQYTYLNNNLSIPEISRLSANIFINLGILTNL